ncbi:MAG: uncharacterized protein JWR66_333, partial [Modestobacter sp.]|nr:uncharacterized protein [Modestobacter sp.]
MRVGGDDVRRSLAAVADLLTRVGDPAAPVPVMGADVRAVVTHVSGCLAFYAHDLVAGPREVTAVDVVGRADADLAGLILGLRAWGEVLSRVVDAAPPGERGWHPHGTPDAGGFAAMGCAELLLHGDDVAQGLGLAFDPPADVAAAVLVRLFPDVGPADDAWTALRWATG